MANSKRKGFKQSEETKRKISQSEKGKKVSEETRNKIGKAYVLTPNRLRQISELGKSQKGANNYQWITDRSKLSKQEERNGNHHKEWSKSVKNRDGWKCKIFNNDCIGRVVAHHILPWAKFPELRYQINNGITLCRFHHPRKRIDEMKLSPYFQSLVLSNSK